MSRFIQYTPAQNEFTTLRFVDRLGSDDVKWFDTHVVAFSGTDEEFEQLLAEQHTECDAKEISFKEFFPMAAKSTQGKFFLKNAEGKLRAKQDEINNHANDRVIATWGKQEAEARAYLADNTVSTPMLDGLLASSNKWSDKASLAECIVQKANYAALEHGKVTGDHDAEIDAYFCA